MTYNEIVEGVNKIFSSFCDLKELSSLQKPLQDYGINSISFIRIIVQLEEKFDFEFKDEDLDYKKFERIEDVYKYIQCKKQMKYRA